MPDSAVNSATTPPSDTCITTAFLLVAHAAKKCLSSEMTTDVTVSPRLRIHLAAPDLLCSLDLARPVSRLDAEPARRDFEVRKLTIPPDLFFAALLPPESLDLGEVRAPLARRCLELRENELCSGGSTRHPVWEPQLLEHLFTASKGSELSLASSTEARPWRFSQPIKAGRLRDDNLGRFRSCWGARFARSPRVSEPACGSRV